MTSDLFIYLYRENGGDGEYVVFSDDKFSQTDIEENALMGFTFGCEIKADASGPVHQLPVLTILMKND